MTKDNMRIWNKGKEVPTTACKKITGGRLKGFTDISPQWRYEKLTELFGPCGIGWYVEFKKLWIEDGAKNEKTANADINLYFKDGDEWSKPVAGIGGASFIALQSGGLYTSDECYKMAVTDAISVCCKQMGIGADIYNGLPATKYPTIPEKDTEPKKEDNTALIKLLVATAKVKGYTEKVAYKPFREGINNYTLEQIQGVINDFLKMPHKKTAWLNKLAEDFKVSAGTIQAECDKKYSKPFEELTTAEMAVIKKILEDK